MGKRNLLQYSAAEAARQVAQALLATAERQSLRLADATDHEALHDFRVSVRRLRTWLKAQREHLDRKAADRGCKRLTKLMRGTSANRDTQVHLQWIERQLRRRRDGMIAMGLRLLRDAITHGAASDAGATPAATARKFQKACRKLRTPLAPSAASTAPEPCFADVAAGQIGRSISELRQLLEAIGSVDDREALHRARLAAKRLRYVIEPISRRVHANRPLGHLKQLQDALGSLHDVHTLEIRAQQAMALAAGAWAEQLLAAADRRQRLATIKRHHPQMQVCLALAAALACIRGEQRRLYQRLEERWLGTNIAAMETELAQIPRQLADHATASAPPQPTAEA